jgi:predicted nucleotide-binding protein (sugar kinase/HSP70/actin superfamily)
MGDYGIILAGLLEMNGIGTVCPPGITKKTLELGSLNSPDTACIPFKYNLGNYLEALENGANTLMTFIGGNHFGGCRLPFYTECHEQILRDLGHNVRLIRTTLKDLFINLKQLNPRIRRRSFWYSFHLHYTKLRHLDRLQDQIRRIVGFEENEGGLERLWEKFLTDLRSTSCFTGLKRLIRRTREEIRAVPVLKPERPLRIGLIGELYVLMEPFSNFEIEKTLGRMGVEVHRWVTLCSILHHEVLGAVASRKLLSWADPYLRYHLGAHGTESVGRMNWMIRNGFDGAIHLKPFGCMPELNAMPALYRLSREHRFPLSCFSLDSHTSRSGVMTRLEAFHDLIHHRRQSSLT